MCERGKEDGMKVWGGKKGWLSVGGGVAGSVVEVGGGEGFGGVGEMELGGGVDLCLGGV